MRALLEDTFRESGSVPSLVHETNDLSLMRSLAALPITTRGLSIERSVVTTIEKSHLKPVQAVRDLIAEQVRRLVLAGEWQGNPHVMR